MPNRINEGDLIENMTTIIVLIIAVITIFIYKMVAEPSEKQLLEKRKSEELVNEQILEFKKNEIIFNQFSAYVKEIFAKTKEISKENLQYILAKDFAGYKNGNVLELYSDLLRADLIEVSYKTKLYHKGSAFNDLRLTFPILVEFLKRKSNVTEGFTHDMHGRFEVEKASISKIINSSTCLVYFTFGVSSGSDLIKELRLSFDNIINGDLYLYTKTEKHIKNIDRMTEKENLHSDYVSLQNDLSSEQYQNILNEWLSQAKSLEYH